MLSTTSVSGAETSNGDASNGMNALDSIDTSRAEAALKAKLSRKRTKSGCLTCRKRRIKCGEERVVCRNCIKSKRHCEGYSQRVSLKQPNFLDFQAAPNGGAHIVFQAMPGPGQDVPYQTIPTGAYSHDAGAYTELRSSLLEPDLQHTDPSTLQHVFAAPQQPGYVMNGMPGPSMQARVDPRVERYGAHGLPTAQGIANGSVHTSCNGINDSALSHTLAVQERNPLHYLVASHDLVNHGSYLQESHAQQRIVVSNSTSSDPPPALANPAGPQATADLQSRARFLSQTIASVSQPAQQQWEAPLYTARPELSRSIDLPPVPISYPTQVQSHQPLPSHVSGIDLFDTDYYEFEAPALTDHTPTQFLNDAAVEVLDDDYYDVQSDEEMEFENSTTVTQDHRPQLMLQRILQSNQVNGQNMQIRRYDTFLQHGMLDRYRVEEVANPLRNPATARVFAHFISATGPSISTFERHPVSSSVLFSAGSIPLSQHGLWTYTMPLAALRNQGLLHAMLALASLHIARLQGGSTTPSIQHYAWALKRIHNVVSSKNPQRRLKVTTIAASMLLGFYEIMTADHVKWNTHLAGAKQLFVETDFAGMTRQFRRLKREKWAREKENGHRNSIFHSLNGSLDLLDQVQDVDETVVSRLVGRQVRYDDLGHIDSPQSKIPQELDLGKFEILKDLFWWYAKQDAYQSFVSGNALLMDYGRWADCPPRAPLGRADTIYGSFDHLVLLLGRIADFASKDRLRKLKQMEQTGGQWVPAAGMNIPRPPQAPHAAAPASAPAGPMFFGMAPPPRANVQMPKSYNPSQHTSPPRDTSFTVPIDLQAATTAALEEYGRIRAALQDYANVLSGDTFQPLDSDHHMPLETPFGPAKFYRRYDIGLLWLIWNMATIITIRSHPHMHPAAHVAAALAANETAHFANEIGRIAAGIVAGPTNQPLNPTLGSALCESCMPSFFAAVQYMRADQRHETVMRIYGIALRTGWGSAELIANGCETAWVKNGEAKRGPPYTRVLRPQSSDDPRLNGSWESLDKNATPDELDEGDRRFVRSRPNARLNWAVGILGMEDDA